MKKRLSAIKHKLLDKHENQVDSSNQTATRTTLSDDWQKRRNMIDWMSVPNMPDYVNGLVSGKHLSENGHWALYCCEKYIQPLVIKTNRNLDLVSLACGNGHVEAALINEFGWPIGSLLGLEYDDQLRASAKERFRNIPSCNSSFQFFDFNRSQVPIKQFDIVFACHSLHHAQDVEGLLEKMNQMLKPDGLIIGIDYFGPTRFQIDYEVLPIIQELFDLLPSELRRNLSTDEKNIQDSFTYDTVKAVCRADISEAVRSSDLRTLLFSTFPAVEIKPMGGTLLRWLFNNRAGNFDALNPDHVAIAKLLQFIEREFISLRRIPSDDLFFVLEKSNRLSNIL